MKFLCGSCRTKYQISDEKVRGKILTIRCKKCGAKILVRESLGKHVGGGTAVAPVAEEERAEVTAKKSVGSMSSARVGGAAALASAFEVAMGGGPAEADDMPTSIAPVPANLEHAGVEWYVAIDGEQFGPYAFADLVRRIVAKEVVGRHYAWHDGMGAWTRVRELKDLASYLPQDKKRPPPPPPGGSGEHAPSEDETQAGPGAEIVDLSLRRAERDRREKHVKAEPPEGETKSAAARAPDTATERAEQLDNVLNEALGIEGEGKTTRAEPERAIAVQGTARAKDGAGIEPSIDELLSFEHHDIFANVPRATDADLVPRESTRFFVAAAGMNARKSKHKVAMIVGGVAASAFILFLASWALGIIRIEIPGIGNPFAGIGVDVFASNDEGSEEVDDDIRGLGGREAKKAAKGARGRRRPTGYIQDDPTSALGGSRGQVDSEGIDINLGDHNLVPGDVVPAELPESGIDDVAIPDGEALSQDVIKKVVHARKQSVSICYSQSLKGQENLRGKLEIRVTVEPSGKVSKALVETSAFKGSKLGECIAGKIQDWRFPSFTGEAQQVLVPFILERSSY